MPTVVDVAGFAAERVEAGHLDGLCRLDSDWRVMESLGGPRSRETTETYLRFDVEQWEEHGFGMYASVSKVASEVEGVVGRVGQRSNVLDGRPEVEVGYSLAPRLWGRGIVTAAVDQIVGLAALTGLAGSVAATVGPDNTASVPVLKKAGFVFERLVERAGEAMLLYRGTLRLDPGGRDPGYAQTAGLIHTRVPAGASVLDLGCGAGARHRDLLAATVTYRHRERRWSQHFTIRRLNVDDLGRALADTGLILRGLFGPPEPGSQRSLPVDPEAAPRSSDDDHDGQAR